MTHETAREEYFNTARYLQSNSLERAIRIIPLKVILSHDHQSLFPGYHGMSSLATEDSRELASFPRPDQCLHFPWHYELLLTSAQPRLQRPPPINASPQPQLHQAASPAALNPTLVAPTKPPESA